MENEKKITAPKRKKSVSTSKKKSAAGETEIESAGKNAGLEEFKIDLVGAVKPARKIKTSEKTVGKPVRTRKSKAGETAKIVEADEVKPRKRKTTVKDKKPSAVEAKTITKKDAPETSVKKISPETTEKKSAKTEIIAAVPNEVVPEIEIAQSPEILSQTEIVPKLKNVLRSETENLPTIEIAAEKLSEVEKSPVFKELDAPKLPVLPPENRAHLQMQSPTRIYFYWTLKNNPYETLGKIFGDDRNQYWLVVKLFNLTRGTEETHRVEAEGNWWFDVDANSTYRAELGFFAMNRPFVRILSSNLMTTPRQNPSPYRALLSGFSVPAKQFARLLDASGYRQDAVEVALAGDDFLSATRATQKSFSQLTDVENLAEQDSGEMRYAMLALASGYALEDLRSRVSPSLMRILQANAGKLSAEKATSVLRENFDAPDEEFFDEETFDAPTVFGASLINFPHGFGRRILPKNFAPLSSHNLVE
ncbi:MAG: DUF4912 domain-containing protein [Pyrinomonadaceae bacterium]